MDSPDSNQVYPENQPEKAFVLPLGVPTSAAPMKAEPPKPPPFEIQIPGMALTGTIAFISLLMSINVVCTCSFTLDLLFYRACGEFISLAYWGLFFYFTAMAIVFPDYLVDDKPEIIKIWPIAFAYFLRLFWMFENTSLFHKEILYVLLGQVLLLICFYFCYFAGSDSWPLGNIFRPWKRINYEPVEVEAKAEVEVENVNENDKEQV